MASRAICGKATVDGSPCRNPARSCAANHPAAASAGGAGLDAGTAAAAAADPLSGGVASAPARPERQQIGVRGALRLLWRRGGSSPRRRNDRIAGIASGRYGQPSPRLLRFLANVTLDKTPLAVIALNSRTPTGTLKGLAGSAYRQVRAGTAANPSTPPGILTRLADDPDPDVRSNVAGNPSTPPGTLARLADDRRAGGLVARNPSTPPGALARIADGEWPEAEAVAANPRTPPEALARLAERLDLSSGALIDLAANPSTPPGTLARLAGAGRPACRSEVAANPSTPPATLLGLANDPDPGVRAAAAANPGCPPAGKAAAGLLAD